MVAHQEEEEEEKKEEIEMHRDYHPSGAVREEYAYNHNNRRHGQRRKWRADGSIGYLREYDDGRYHGRNIRWWPNGRIRSSQMSERHRPMDEFSWYADGSICSVWTWATTPVVTLTKWYKNGVRGLFAEYTRGGCKLAWDRDGQPMEFSEFEEDDRQASLADMEEMEGSEWESDEEETETEEEQM